MEKSAGRKPENSYSDDKLMDQDIISCRFGKKSIRRNKNASILPEN